MSIFRPLISAKMRPALLFTMLALVVLSWVLLKTPHRAPEATPSPTVVTAKDEFGRQQEQTQTREKRKAYLAEHHKKLALGSRSGGDTCDYNLTHLGSALEAYRADHSTYPAKLSELVPDYIAHLPNCPSGGKETYSLAYTVSPYGYQCTLGCTEKHEKWAPHYESLKGMVYPEAEGDFIP
ncbi:hypothetical protein ABS71_03195 [bacterium SCN 62-11]|nr:hypothetical protein [Candidatus Eremiobacteraeota bacterium]ODT76720.1 MAG: hypothetical protein ABS71_03195 [bacterium SCN 62-11]